MYGQLKPYDGETDPMSQCRVDNWLPATSESYTPHELTRTRKMLSQPHQWTGGCEVRLYSILGTVFGDEVPINYARAKELPEYLRTLVKSLFGCARAGDLRRTAASTTIAARQGNQRRSAHRF